MMCFDVVLTRKEHTSVVVPLSMGSYVDLNRVIGGGWVGEVAKG